jgi:hypothetical protein
MAENAHDVSVEPRANGFLNEWLPMFGAENQVDQHPGKRLWHSECGPFRA